MPVVFTPEPDPVVPPVVATPEPEARAPRAKRTPKAKPVDYRVVFAGFGIWRKGDLIAKADLPEGCNVDYHLSIGSIEEYTPEPEAK